MPINVKQLHGKTVTFESHRYHAWFLDGREKPMDAAVIHPLGDSERDGFQPDKSKIAKWPKWKVIVRDEARGVVSLESIDRPEHFLDLNHRKGWNYMNAISVTWCVNSRSVGKWGQFKIHGDTLLDATIQCERWTDRWLVAHEHRSVMGANSHSNENWQHKHVSDTPADSHDRWGHWRITDVHAKPPADEAAGKKKEGRRIGIVSAKWFDTRIDLPFAQSVSETVGLEKFNSTGTTEEIGGSHGVSVEIGFSAEFLGSGVSTDIGVHSEVTHNRGTTVSAGTTNMRYTERTCTGNNQNGKSTVFRLAVRFDTGDTMTVLATVVDTDRHNAGPGYPDMFNPDKFPKMKTKRALLGAVAAAMNHYDFGDEDDVNF